MASWQSAQTGFRVARLSRQSESSNPSRSIRYTWRPLYATEQFEDENVDSLDGFAVQQNENEIQHVVHDKITTNALETKPWASLLKDIPTQPILLLNLVAILWGSQHAVIKLCLQESDHAAGPFTLLRFGLAALLASPYTPGLKNWLSFEGGESSDSSSKTTRAWRWGIEMGIWMFLGFAFQAIGLEYTTAQKSGFLLYLNVKFVPILAFLLIGRSISTATWISALAAFTGTALLASSSADQSASASWNVGDVWSIAAALASAMFILRLERASEDVDDAAGLNAACLWVVTVLAAIWTVAQTSLDVSLSFVQAWQDLVGLATSHPMELIYLGGVTTALANLIQTKAQREISAERASVIYAMDPVYGAAFSSLLLGENLNGLQAWIGAGLIAVAAASNSFTASNASVTTMSSSDIHDEDQP